MAFQCANCGGNILFDVDSQAMKCQHCDSVFAPEQFSVRNRSAETRFEEAGLTLFTCGGCGAELQGTEESQVGFCPYCGSQSLLVSSRGSASDTETVLPFQISRERCVELFREHSRRARYLPRDMKDPEHLESFTGIYMPYYEYDVEMGKSNIQGSKTVERHSRYDVVNTYRIDAEVDGNYCGVPYDASRYFDDEIAARTLPFDTSKERPFNPAYLSGFYADASTVPPETYYRDAEEQASKDIVEEVAERIYNDQKIVVEKGASSVEAHTRGHHSALLPLWFLTWRKGGRVAYAVVNGESGKVVADLPVDFRSFALGCLVIAVILFAALEALFQPTPVITSVISLIAGMLMAFSIRSSTKRIFEKQTHANDKGWSSGAEPTAYETSSGKKQKKKKQFVFPVEIIVVIAVIAISMATQNLTRSLPPLVALAALLLVVFSVVRIAVWQKSIPEKQPILAILPVLAAVILNAAIVFFSPVNDAWYYMGDAVCILILILASVLMMRVYNIGTMRPLPKLFGREEVQ